jgi:3-phenylpropionate/trans-cinnamate dioxygenase ferredoxin reductase subunit
MTTRPSFVIVGASLAGAKAAQALREEGFDGRITLIGDEPHRPYERPPLSKEYLQGKSERENVFVHPQGWYAEHDVDLQMGVAVVAIDRDAKHIALADGRRIPYDKLLLTTGSSPRALKLPGAELAGVHYLRRIEDCEQIKAAFDRGARVGIIGAGWIGLEAAAAARDAGLDVTVLEQAELPLVRVLGRQIAQVFADLHRAHDVDLRLDQQVAEITGANGAVTGIRLADGSETPADVVLVGVGITPNTGLAVASGLAVDNGITVDEHLQTADPDVFAAGDVANAYHRFLGRRIRVEHWANALNQPATVAKSMLGQHASYDRLPYFYTDQYDLGMEYTGYADPDDFDQVVLRGDAAAGEFIAFWLREGRVLAGMNVNVWDVTDPIQQLILSRQQLDPKRLADLNQPLANLVG